MQDGDPANEEGVGTTAAADEALRAFEMALNQTNNRLSPTSLYEPFGRHQPREKKNRGTI